MYTHDAEVPYENVFALVSQFYHGGIALWNRFDLMNFSYAHLTGGVYTLVNILTAGIYIILSTLINFPNEGEAFHWIFCVSYHALLIFIRTAGGFLLLQKLGLNRIAIFFALIYLNILFSHHMFTGFLPAALYSYLPLLLYTFIRFFESWKVKDLALLLLMVTLVVSNSPLFSLGYFYQTVHFFVLALISFKIISTKGKIFLSFKELWTRRVAKEKGLMLVTTLVCFFIFWPSIEMFFSLKNDFYMANSGWSGTQGRLQNFFNINKYFSATNYSIAFPQEFFFSGVDFMHNRWGASWLFIGVSTFFFSFVGIFLSKNRYKYVFLGAIILIVLANTIKNPMAWTSLAHWINALTNPFSFLLRSYHMSALLMPYYLFPLVGLGLQVFWDAIGRQNDKWHKNRLAFMLMFNLAFIGYAVFYSPSFLRTYLIFASLIFFSLIIFLIKICNLAYSLRNFWISSVALIFLIFGCLLMEGWALTFYLRDYYYQVDTKLQSYLYKGLEGHGPLMLEFQNPKILPFEEHVRLNKEFTTPLAYTHQNSYGLFYHFTHLGRFFRKNDIYEPRHISFKDLPEDYLIQEYLKRNNRWAVFINDTGMIDSDVSRWISSMLSLKDAKKRVLKEGDQYAWDLSSVLPLYLATEVFTDDFLSWQLRYDGRFLKVAQGQLVEPFTYDFQNIKKAQLTVLFPKGFIAESDVVNLKVKLPQEIIDIGLNEHDRFGFSFAAKDPGWLILHIPYDSKWQIFVDQQRVDYQRLNKYFIGIPLSSGTHQILLSYWPQTLLRGLIIISMVLIVLSFIVIIGYSFRQIENPPQQKHL